MGAGLREALTPDAATRLIKTIVRTGRVVFWHHVLKALADDKLTTVDAVHVLRAGFVNEPAELKNDAWRYRMRTARMVVVVQLESPEELAVVTAWRLTR